MQQYLPGAHHIADYLLATAKLYYKIELDQLQLNKLCYLVNGFVLREHGRPAFRDDVEAWKYGPVVPSVYKTYRVHEDRPITQLYLCQTPLSDRDAVAKRWTDLVGIIGMDVAATAGGVVEHYGKYTGSQLVSMTHRRGTPWKKAYRPGCNNVIPVQSIKQFYRNLKEDDRGR